MSPSSGAPPLSVDLSPSPELSYVIGTMFGDGYLQYAGYPRYNYGIGLTAKDLDFVEFFEKSLRKLISTRKRLYSIWKNKHGYYVFSAYSKILYEFFNNRHENLERYKYVTEKYPIEFMRGFYDSEGYVSHATRRDIVGVSNNNIELLQYIQGLLSRLFNIISRMNKCSENAYALLIQRQAGIIKYAQYIGFTINRKSQKLNSIATKLSIKEEHRQKRRILRNRAIELRREGMSFRKIGNKLGIDNTLVFQWTRNPEGRILIWGE